ncbi:MAG: hypothetical protein LBR29_09090 [Methylobacteriaceae bacterium]|nr:hypothetical protein [Methylobacteriaceae bacterium]
MPERKINTRAAFPGVGGFPTQNLWDMREPERALIARVEDFLRAMGGLMARDVARY